MSPHSAPCWAIHWREWGIEQTGKCYPRYGQLQEVLWLMGCSSYGAPTGFLAPGIGKAIDSPVKWGTCTLRMHYTCYMCLQKNCFHNDFFIPAVEHSGIQWFVFIFYFTPFVYLSYHSCHIWPNWFSTLCSKWSSFIMFNGRSFNTGLMSCFFSFFF